MGLVCPSMDHLVTKTSIGQELGCIVRALYGKMIPKVCKVKQSITTTVFLRDFPGKSHEYPVAGGQACGYHQTPSPPNSNTGAIELFMFPLPQTLILGP